MRGKKIAVATIAHSQSETAFCASVIATKAFDLARTGGLALPGFPDFKKAVQELKNVQAPPQPDYEVCVAVGDALVIKEALIEQWKAKPEFVKELESLVKTHNDEFNKKGIKRGSQAAGNNEESPAKRLCISSEAVGLDEFETRFSSRPGMSKMLQVFFF